MTQKSLPEDVNELLGELTEARSLSERMSETNQTVEKVRMTDDKIRALKQRAESLIAELGCADPRAKEIHKAMADMVISWEMSASRNPAKRQT